MLLANANIYIIPKVISKMFSYLIVLYEFIIFTVSGIYPLLIMIQKHKSIKRKRERESETEEGVVIFLKF